MKLIDRDLSDKERRMVQLQELEIAKEIKRICEKYNISYFLEYGSLLGAVRHSGFIPWDDDIDIGMKREEYKRFCEIADKELKYPFYFIDWDKEPNYGQQFGKVIMTESNMVEKISRNVNCTQGIFVDIYPFDYITDDKKKLKRNILIQRILRKIMMCKCGYDILLNGSLMTVLSYFPAKLLSKCLKLETIKNKMKEIIEQSQATNKCMLYIGDANLNHVVRKTKWLDELEQIKFEDTEFSVSKYRHEILSLRYGDYMTPLPENQRSSNHNFLIKIE